MKELIYNVIMWARSRDLIQKDNSFKQLAKAIEELGEVGSALLKKDKIKLKDGIGDVMVTMIILAKQNDLDLEDCLEFAYNEIKDRKGKTINGTFIKAEDLNEPILKKEDLKESDFIGDYYNEECIKQ